MLDKICAIFLHNYFSKVALPALYGKFEDWLYGWPLQEAREHLPLELEA